MKSNHAVATTAADPGQAWNDFWLSPHSTRSAARLRMIAGSLACLFWLTWLGDAPKWFSAAGLLSPAIVRSTAVELGRTTPLTPIMFIESSSGLIAIVVLGAAVSALLAYGVRPAITGPAALILFSAWINRAPEFLTSAELIVGMLLIAMLPLIALPRTDSRHWSARLSLRLAQVAATMILLAIAIAIIAQPMWRNGTAVWELASHSLSRPLNLDRLRESPLLVNAWTHAIATAFCFLPLGLWLPKLRRWAGLGAVLAILSLIPVTGEWFAALAVAAAISPFFLEEHGLKDSD